MIGSIIVKFISVNSHNQMSDLRLKCTKFNFGWGSAPDPAGGAYSAPTQHLAGFKGPTSKGRGGKEGGTACLSFLCISTPTCMCRVSEKFTLQCNIKLLTIDRNYKESVIMLNHFLCKMLIVKTAHCRNVNVL